MSSPETLTTNAFENAQTFAEEAMDLVDSFLNEFSSNLYTAPLVDVVWSSVTPPTVEDAPALPDFATPTFDMPAAPAALDIEAPTIDFTTFTEVAPAVDVSGQPGLDFGTKPTVTIGDVPAVYTVTTPDVPEAPTLTDVSLPSLLSLSTPSFAGVDLHESFLADIETDLPTLTLVAPTPYTYTPGAAYTSALKTAISSNLATRIAGGTGLSSAVETALWGRAADRETAAGDAAIDDATEGNEALGWSLPTGALQAGVRKAQQNKRNRMADLSREIAIEQAKLEQTNIQKAIDQGIQWEGELIGYSLNLEKIAFESARILAENAIQVHNAGVERFRALFQGIQVRVSLYDAIIKGETLKIEELKANVALEQAKADINKALVEQYKAEIDGRLAVVRLYETRLSAVKTLVDIEKTKVEASAEAIRGFTAGVNAQVAQVEVYKAGVQAEGIKADAWKTNIQGQLGTVQVYTAKADAFKAIIGGEAARASALQARYTGLTQAKEAEFRGFSAQVDAQRARVLAESEVGRLLLSAYEAASRTVEAKNNMNARLFEAQFKLADAQATYTMNGQKINSDIIAHNSAILLEAAKAGTQVAAQLASSAMGQAHATAGIDGRSGTTVSYNYSNDTDSAPPSITTA